MIVNDIGEVNIDASLIRKGGVVGKKEADGDLVALQNGCICCTLKMDLVEQLSDIIATGEFDYIVIEASGICEPEPIAQTIESMPMMDPRYTEHGTPRLDCIATVVDALRMQSEFAGGDDLQRKDIDEEDLENLIIQQIEFCNLIILNKISEVTREQADHLRAIIKALQPRAEIIECDYCDFDLSRLLDTHLFDFERTATSATWIHELERPATTAEEHEAHEDHHHHEHDDDDDDEHEHDHEHHHEHEHHHHHHHDGEGEAEEYGIQTFVYYRRQGFDMNKFDFYVTRRWPKNIIRTKGLVYFNESPDMSYIFEQAGVQKSLTQSGLWLASAPEDELQAMVARDPGLIVDWDDEYGDRMVKLVFIGRNLDKKAISDALDLCM